MCETRCDKLVTQIVFINMIDSNTFYNSTDELRVYCTLHMYQTYTTLQSMCSYLFLDVTRSAALRRKRQYFEFRTRAVLVRIPSSKMVESETVLNPTTKNRNQSEPSLFSTNTVRRDGGIRDCFKHDNRQQESIRTRPF